MSHLHHIATSDPAVSEQASGQEEDTGVSHFKIRKKSPFPVPIPNPNPNCNVKS